MEAGEITFVVNLDNEELEKALKKTESDITSTKIKLMKTESEKSFIEKEMDEANAAIYKTDQEIDKLKAKLASLNDSPGNAADLAKKRASLMGQLEAKTKTRDSQIAESDALSEKWQKADKKAQDYQSTIGQLKQQQNELSQEYAQNYKANSNSVSEALASAENRFGKFKNRINTMVKKVFFFGVILAGLRALKSYVSDAMGENEKLAGSFEQVKAVITGFSAGVIQAMLPVLLGFAQIIVAIFKTIAGLIDMVFNTNIVKTIESAQKAAGSLKKQTKETKDLAKAQKEANAQLMSFDELNKMDDNKDTSSPNTDAGAGGTGGSKFNLGQIDDTLGAIMGILGAALLAVGAILCFSGINIPLGIGLMAIGALMIYSVAKDNWQKLPADVQQAITGALVLVGLTLIVIGAVLAFSTAAIPVGIGMIAAGAALLWGAVALNWNSMSQEMKNAVSAVMVILGAALLVIGAILALSGGGTPLGIGLMVIGAASMVGAVALNWDALPEEVQTAIGVIFAVISVAFLVLGAILALTGPATALGVGLLIVGAGLLVSAVALNWSKMPQDVKNTVSQLLQIIGSALIVIGIILLCTGAGIPLGVACILAGIGAFVAGTALNWDFMKNKIIGMWNSIVSWWNSTVAPIFTAGWWRDKFKSIVNGLIYAVNTGLNAFGGFINNIANGISGVLGMFGVSWHGSVSMPQIPYLAQGAVIPPNRKFMAVLGDQSAGNNLEAPESLIRQIVREESGNMDYQSLVSAVQQGFALAMAMNGGGSDSGSDTNATIVLQVGNEELARAVYKGKNRLIQRGELKPEISFG